MTSSHSIETKQDTTEEYDCVVSAAAIWTLIVGQSLFTQIVQAHPESRPQDGVFVKPGKLFAGPTFGIEGWSS